MHLGTEPSVNREADARANRAQDGDAALKVRGLLLFLQVRAVGLAKTF